MNKVIKKGFFSKGLKLAESKISASKPIQELPLPKKVLILLQQHFGEPCSPIVSRGDKVKTGQIIADSEKLFSAPLHATITGTVTNISKVINPFANNIVSAVEITGEGEDIWTDLEPNIQISAFSDSLNRLYPDGFKNDSLNEHAGSQDVRTLWGKLIKAINETSSEEIIKKVKNAGITGLGGATFPTHIKLSTKKEINTLIINGCECEPYITADHRIMLEYGWKVLAGAYIIFKVLSPKIAYIAIENNKENAILLFSRLIEEAGLEEKFKVISLKSSYPMGAEKTLIKNVLGKKVPVGGLPMDIGAVVNNVGTVKAVFDAVSEGLPLISKVVTITGDLENPQNLLARIGTPLKDLINYGNRLEKSGSRVILGGPMMGNIIVDLNFPVTKAVNCIMLKKTKRLLESNCIRCGRCVNICPMNLMPLMYAAYAKNSKFEVLRDYHISTCIECGSCAYVCPASIPIVAYIKTAKSVLTGYGK
ncbi:MAG: electron transport complex subunit RsxC [Candidatus Humimicrobiaceae bacterium]